MANRLLNLTFSIPSQDSANGLFDAWSATGTTRNWYDVTNSGIVLPTPPSLVQTVNGTLTLSNPIITQASDNPCECSPSDGILVRVAPNILNSFSISSYILALPFGRVTTDQFASPFTSADVTGPATFFWFSGPSPLADGSLIYYFGSPSNNASSNSTQVSFTYNFSVELVVQGTLNNSSATFNYSFDPQMVVTTASPNAYAQVSQQATTGNGRQSEGRPTPVLA